MSSESLLSIFALLVVRLEVMNCPILPKGQWTRELVYQAGPTRCKLLVWLLDKYAENDEIMEPPGENNFYEDILTRCNQLGLVQEGEEVELIKGLGPPPIPHSSIQRQADGQVYFLDALSEMVLLASSSETERLLQQNKSDNNLFSSLSVSPLHTIFPHTCNLLAPDLAKLPDPPAPRNRETHEEMLTSITYAMETALADRREQVDALRNAYVSEGSPEEEASLRHAKVDAMGQLQFVLQKLLITSANFINTYTNEMAPWTQQPQAQLSALGPTCQRTNQMLKQLQAVLEGYHGIQQSDHTLKELECHLQRLSKQAETGHGISQGDLETLEKDLLILQSGLRRMTQPLLSI